MTRAVPLASSLLLLSLAIAAGGCGSHTSVVGEQPGGSGAGAAAGTAGAAAGGAAAGGASAGGGEPCGEAVCGPDAYCRWTYFYCNVLDLALGQEDIGACVPRPTTCDPVDEPVCGCDGVAYANRCEAAALGVDLGADTCTAEDAPPGQFQCGPSYCDPTSYCDQEYDDIGARTYQCRPLPADCPAPGSCDCFPPVWLSHCESVPGNGVTGVMIVTFLM